MTETSPAGHPGDPAAHRAGDHPDRPTPDLLPTAEESAADQASAVEAADRDTPPSSSLPRDLEELRESTPGSSGPHGAAGGMGVSSERVGHTGPGQTGTDGLNPSAARNDDGGVDADQSGEATQSAGGAAEENPVGLKPKAGYPSRDPRSEDHPFQTRGPVGGA